MAGLDISTEAGLHVYGQPIPRVYPAHGTRRHASGGTGRRRTGFPSPTLHRLAGLDEDFYIYEGKLAVSLPPTFTQDEHDAVVQVAVRYQACSDKLGCFLSHDGVAAGCRCRSRFTSIGQSALSQGLA